MAGGDSPTKNFDYDNQPDGMITVGFSRMKWKIRKDEATINFTIE